VSEQIDMNEDRSPARGKRSMSALVAKGLADPGAGVAHVFAVLRGHWYRVTLPMRGRRFRVGANFRVFGRLSVRGPGEVVFGDDVVMWGRVNAWTYASTARIVVGDNVMMSGTRFGCAAQIRVGRNSILADAAIRDTDFHSTRADRRSPDAPIRTAAVDIGENVWVAASAVLLPGTSIGENRWSAPRRYACAAIRRTRSFSATRRRWRCPSPPSADRRR
jgi:acetyltransferase-like isoleucine patch superfamily enzyme